MNSLRKMPTTSDEGEERRVRRQMVEGTALGIFAAVAYTVSNLGLRHVAAGGDANWALFVSANKALPTALIAWGLIAWRSTRGLPGLPPASLWLPLVLTGFVTQFGGDVLFQFALSRGGLALSVPLTFSTILVSGAVLGRLILREPLTPRMLLAMGTMVTAVAVLSRGAQSATQSLVVGADWRTTLLAVASACLSGIGYGACGVMIRRCVTSHLSYSATIVFISSVGAFVVGPLAIVRLGLPAVAALSPEVWLTMLGAGLANGLAFFAVSAAFKRLSVMRVNLLNASQTAMAGIAGVVLFAEPQTWWLVAGTLLTIGGLVLSAGRERTRASSPSVPESEVISVGTISTLTGVPHRVL